MESQWLPVSLVVWITALAGTLDARQQARFVQLCTGLLFARGRRTVTSWLRGCGMGRDYKRYYYLLGSVGRKTPAIARALLRILLKRLPGDGAGTPLVFAIDDSPTKRYGPHVEGAGKHHNPTPGPAGSKFLYGHVWVCLARLVRHPLWGAIALPIVSHLYIRAKDVGWMAAYYGWQFHTKLELAAAQIEWLVQQLGPNRPPIWVVTDGAYAKRPFLKRVLAAGVTVISRLRCDAALWSLPVVVDPGQKRGRGRPPKYGKNRIDLAKLCRADAGLADRAFLPLRSASGQEVQDVLGDLQAGGWGDPCGAGARARSLGGVLFDRPGSERGVDPRDGGRPLGVGAGLPRRQGGARSGTAAVASCVGQRGGVEPDRLVAHAGGAVGLGPAAVPVAPTGATRRGTSQSVVRRMPIAARSYVARRYRKNIRRYRQWRACAEKSAGSFSASCAGSHEADSSGKVQSWGMTSNKRGCEA